MYQLRLDIKIPFILENHKYSVGPLYRSTLNKYSDCKWTLDLQTEQSQLLFAHACINSSFYWGI